MEVSEERYANVCTTDLRLEMKRWKQILQRLVYTDAIFINASERRTCAFATMEEWRVHEILSIGAPNVRLLGWLSLQVPVITVLSRIRHTACTKLRN